MTSRRVVAALAAVAVLVALVVLLVTAPWSDDPSSADTTTSSSTTTTVAATTTSSSTTSTSTTSTSTTSTSTTTTIAAVVGLDMSAEGLGDALFGADADSVVSYVRTIIGDPSTDSGWIDPLSSGAACPGTEIRFVTWNDLSLFFTDDSVYASGSRHFASYTYGPAFGSTIDPYGITTEAGVGVGDTVQLLVDTYPDGTLSPGDDMFPPTFLVADGLHAFLTDGSPTGTVISWVGGNGCGE